MLNFKIPLVFNDREFFFPFSVFFLCRNDHHAIFAELSLLKAGEVAKSFYSGSEYNTVFILFYYGYITVPAFHNSKLMQMIKINTWPFLVLPLSRLPEIST